MYLDFLPQQYGYFDNTIILGEEEKGNEFRNLRLSFCKCAQPLPTFRAGKNEHASLTIYRCV